MSTTQQYTKNPQKNHTNSYSSTTHTTKTQYTTQTQHTTKTLKKSLPTEKKSCKNKNQNKTNHKLITKTQLNKTQTHTNNCLSQPIHEKSDATLRSTIACISITKRAVTPH